MSSYSFLIDLGGFDDEELRIFRDIGCEIQVPSHPLSDERYIRLQWLLKFRQRLDLEHPRTFNEKIQWLKLNYRRSMMPSLVDKLAVREFVADRIGREYLNTLYASADTLREINPKSLPQSFMVKCTHGSAWNVPVPDKAEVDWTATVEKVDRWLGINYYDLRREWVYKPIRPGIIIERFLQGFSLGLLDYKIFCFNGSARYIQVDLGRQVNHTRAIYDVDWHRLPCELRYPAGCRDIPAPENLQHMLALAEALADGFPFVRVDFFNQQGEIIFGEMTFYPGNGFESFTPEKYDRVFGDLLELPDICREDTDLS